MTEETKKVRSDAENIRIIEGLRSEHEKLTNLLIRSEAELEREESDLKELKANLIEKCGTDDLDKIRDVVKNNYEENTRKVDEFQKGITKAKEAIQKIDGE